MVSSQIYDVCFSGVCHQYHFFLPLSQDGNGKAPLFAQAVNALPCDKYAKGNGDRCRSRTPVSPETDHRQNEQDQNARQQRQLFPARWKHHRDKRTETIPQEHHAVIQQFQTKADGLCYDADTAGQKDCQGQHQHQRTNRDKQQIGNGRRHGHLPEIEQRHRKNADRNAGHGCQLAEKTPFEFLFSHLACHPWSEHANGKCAGI